MPSIFDSAACPAKCLDCGLDYDQFGMDTQVPRSQWLTIHPAEGGLLCANCIVRRITQRIPGAIVVHLIAEVGARWHCRARATADPPQDCGWPTCGCDPYADSVIAALQESGQHG